MLVLLALIAVTAVTSMTMLVVEVKRDGYRRTPERALVRAF